VLYALESRALELLTLPQWILLFQFDAAFPPRIAEFRKIVPPKDRFWADPHVLHRGGRYYVFVEEYLFHTRKGHISVLVLDEHGRYEGPLKVLERDYHLSYPFVFEAGGELYMIPESADNRTVELYKCVEFPLRWTFVKNLLEGIAAFDATVLHHEGEWWLFATVVENRGGSSWDDLFLFHCDSIFGEWIPHRFNPVISDVRRARPAGAIVSHNGQLYRPSQDSATRYGRALNLNRIERLAIDDYEEECVAIIAPEGDGGLRGVHTYARADRLTVLDALRPRARFGLTMHSARGSRADAIR
jgi:hypothetical protein